MIVKSDVMKITEGQGRGEEVKEADVGFKVEKGCESQWRKKERRKEGKKVETFKETGIEIGMLDLRNRRKKVSRLEETRAAGRAADEGKETGEEKKGDDTQDK